MGSELGRRCKETDTKFERHTLGLAKEHIFGSLSNNFFGDVDPLDKIHEPPQGPTGPGAEDFGC